MTVPPLMVHGWAIYAHPLFLDALEGLVEDVEARKLRDPQNWHRKNCAKRLAAVIRLATEIIPSDPGAPNHRQGKTLGHQRKHWFRAKFLQQYRLFYRFNRPAKVIVLAWLNDDQSLRAYGSRKDAYTTFRTMLEGGSPPEDFDILLSEAKSAARRFAGILPR